VASPALRPGEDGGVRRFRARWPWIAAALLHAALLALLAGVARPHEKRQAEDAAIEIEVTAPEPESGRAEPALEPADAAEEPDEAPPEERRAPDRAPRRAARTQPEPESEPPPAGAMGETAESGLALGWGLGSILDGAGDGGGGEGGGIGRAGGRGRGAGRAAARAAPVRAAVLRVSKARPPRLVYPRRFRDERAGEVFVALLTVDEDGWVVGVRLVKGVDPHADEKALSAVWRFHYEPALDPAGRPVRAKVEQRFMVE